MFHLNRLCVGGTEWSVNCLQYLHICMRLLFSWFNDFEFVVQGDILLFDFTDKFQLFFTDQM